MKMIENTRISEPFKWLDDNIWEYLSDYISGYDYTKFDDMYRVITNEITFQDYKLYNYPETSIEEVKYVYQKEFPKLMAKALKEIALDIEKGEIIVQFDEC